MELMAAVCLSGSLFSDMNIRLFLFFLLLVKSNRCCLSYTYSLHIQNIANLTTFFLIKKYFSINFIVIHKKCKIIYFIYAIL